MRSNLDYTSTEEISKTEQDFTQSEYLYFEDIYDEFMNSLYDLAVELNTMTALTSYTGKIIRSGIELEHTGTPIARHTFWGWMLSAVMLKSNYQCHIRLGLDISLHGRQDIQL